MSASNSATHVPGHDECVSNYVAFDFCEAEIAGLKGLGCEFLREIEQRNWLNDFLLIVVKHYIDGNVLVKTKDYFFRHGRRYQVINRVLKPIIQWLQLLELQVANLHSVVWKEVFVQLLLCNDVQYHDQVGV